LNLADDSQCEVVTRKCEKDLAKLGWTLDRQVTQLFLALRPEPRKAGGDFLDARWCEDSYGYWHPCDSYEIRFDEHAGKRNPRGLPVYFKFSISLSGTLMLSLVSCHL